MNDEDRIRAEAHKLWLAEGCPEGRAERHWAEAKEIVALRESFETTLKPLDETVEEPVEPAIAFENQGDFPGLTDLGDESPRPNWSAATETADIVPLSTDRQAESSTSKSSPAGRGTS